MNAEYTVEFVDPSYRKAKVRARIPLSGNSVMMEGGIAGAFQDGWSTFVGNLTAKDDDQKIVKLKRAGRDRWEIPEPTPQTLGLSYTVILGHDRYPDKWPFGYKQAAYGRQDYAFYTGKSLFVATPELADATISFTLPAGWKVRTGWKETSESPNKFSAQGLTELWHTGLVVGNPREKRVAVENVSSTVVSGKKMRLSVELLADTVVRLIPEAAKVFGGSPNEKVLVVVDCDSEYLHEGGEAFNRSILLMFQRPAGEENRSHWSHVLTHELIHLWIGYTIQFHDQHRVEWFLEGVTDYLTLLLQARLGMISLDGLLEGLSFNYEEYGKRAGSISLVEAGANKAKNYWLIYSGGAMVAMALDSEIRSRSENRYGLERLLQEMYRDSLEHETKFTADKIYEATARSVTGRNMRLFFDDYVYGREVIPLEDYQEALGLALDGKRIRAMPGGRGKQLIEKWIGHTNSKALPN